MIGKASVGGSWVAVCLPPADLWQPSCQSCWSSRQVQATNWHRPLCPLPHLPQAFSSLSSSPDQAASIVSQVMGGTLGEVQDYGELMIQTRFGEEVRVSCKGSRAGTGETRGR